MNLKEYLGNLGKSSVLLDPLYYGAGNSFFESMVELNYYFANRSHKTRLV